MLLQFCFCEDLNFGFLVGACLTRSEDVFDVDCAISGTEIVEDWLRKWSTDRVLRVFPALNCVLIQFIPGYCSPIILSYNPATSN